MRINVNEQVHLSPILASDQAALVECLNDPVVHRFTLTIPYPYTEAHAVDYLARLEKQTQEQGRPLSWAIRVEGGRLIGGLGFKELELGKSHRAEIGYWLARAYWGRGVMTAVVREACAFAFQEFGLVKICAHVFAGNEASARVLIKCGFEQEGYFRKHHRKDGQLLDSRVFALLKDD